MILQRAKYLKGSKIDINEDYTDAVRQKKKRRNASVESCSRQRGHRFSPYDQLIIDLAAAPQDSREMSNPSRYALELISA